MTRWHLTQTRRLFRVANGGTPTSDPENWDGDIQWATPIDLAAVDGGHIGETRRTITQLGLDTGSGSVPKGSLILSTRAPIGYVAETVAETAFNQGCRGLVPIVDADVRFFRYQYRAMAGRLAAQGLGSTFMELSTDSIAATEVATPPLGAQRAIADFLDTETARMDALITQKRKHLELLNEYMSAMRETILTQRPGVRLVPLMHLTDPYRPIVYGIVQAGP